MESTGTRLRTRLALGVLGAALSALVAPAAGAAPTVQAPTVQAPTVQAPTVQAPTVQAASASDEQALAERYAPVVRLVQQAEDCGRGEPFQPTDVDVLLGNTTVALRGPWDTDDLVKIAPLADDLGKGLAGYHLDFPGSPLQPGCTYEEWADTQTLGSSPTTYARVVTEPGEDGLALQYWLYYPFNDFNNKHESDWEMIQVEFAAADAATALQQEPTRVGFSQHEGVEIARWDDPKLEVAEDSHPVVHPAAGSHANYFDAALHLGRSGQQGFGCDDTRAPSVDVRPAVVLVPSDASEAGATFPWLSYTGRWGQRESSFYNGPTGPNTKDQWTAPLTWTDAEGTDTAYAVPASGLYGTEATSAFCGIVSSGSNALRGAMNNPAIAAAALVALGLVMAWLAGRTTWRPSAPLRLARRRSTGQVISAVWRLYTRRLALFVGIGLPITVAMVLPGLASAWIVSTTEAFGDDGTMRRTIVTVTGLLLALLAPATVALGQAAAVVAVREIDGGRRVGVSRAYSVASPRAIPLLLTQLAIGVALVACLVTVVLAPVAVVLFVVSLLLVPVVVLEGLSGWAAVRRSAHLVRPSWVKVVVLVGLTAGLAYGVGAVLGAVLILTTSLPLAVSNAVSGFVYAALAPLVAVSSVYIYADVVVREKLATGAARDGELPAEAMLP
ncbi:hypothetical protein [Fodinibacter luteus]|uniref:hypothetical protein n=1 Tax=Fodinibacter luteus TaxID=552064 RepID=UPI0031EBDE97